MKAEFSHCQTEAERIISFYFSPRKSPFRYVAGQFIELSLPHDRPDNRGSRRWFTLSSSPTEKLLSITTKLPAEGPVSSFKQTLIGLQPGDEMQISEPMGDFVLPMQVSRPLVMIAGGIGITPMRSMIKWLTDSGQQREIKLIYGVNNLQEAVFRDLLESYPLELLLVPSQPPASWTGPSGKITPELISQLAGQDKHQLYYIAGPEPMVANLIKQLPASGIAANRLIGDYFPNYPDAA